MGQAWNAPGASGTLAMIGIEQVSYQAAAVQEALRRTMLPIVPVVPDKDKAASASACWEPEYMRISVAGLSLAARRVRRIAGWRADG
jgi:hypothetical protein